MGDLFWHEYHLCSAIVIAVLVYSIILDHVLHDDVVKWKHFLRNWPFVRGIHRSPENSPHKGQWRGALMFSLICAWINVWVNNHEAGDLGRHGAHYDVIVMGWAQLQLDTTHYSDMTWVSWCLKSQAIQLFLHALVQPNKEENATLCFTGP